MTPKVPKLVTSTHYHLWTDALHARALAAQARNTWDRGAYVRWAVNTAWTVFETACEDALCTTGLGNRFKEKLDQAVSAASLSPLDWSMGLWQRVLNVYRLRKEYVHVALPQNRLFADIAEANDAINVMRDAIKRSTGMLAKRLHTGLMMIVTADGMTLAARLGFPLFATKTLMRVTPM